MLGFELQRLLQCRLPLDEGLVREAVHQVDAEVREARASGSLHRVTSLGRVVAASQGGQVAVVEGLDADADPVEAALQPGGELCVVEVVGVGLQGGLGVRVQCEGVSDRGHHGADVIGGEVGRRASAEEDGADRRAARQPAPEADLAPQRLGVAGHQRLYTSIGVEVAVRALGLAERDVQVQRDRDVCMESGCGHGASLDAGRRTQWPVLAPSRGKPC